jgi:hypothetical protein
MEKENLIKSASLLKQPGAEAYREISKKREMLAGEINEQFKQRTDLLQMIGEGNIDMMMDNHRNHIRFMVSLFGDYHPEVLVETVLWVFRAYRSHGFKLTYWPAQLDMWVEIMKKNLSPECFDEVYPFYDWMIINNPVFAKLSDEILFDESNLKIGNHH